MRRIFKNDEHEAQLDARGYVLIPAGDLIDVDKLVQFYHQHHRLNGEGFYTTQASNDQQMKALTAEVFKDCMADFVDRYLIDFRIVAGNFAIKAPGTKSTLPLHQDWSIVDEQKHRYVNVWCSLQDIEVEDGALRFLDRSDRLPRQPRSFSVPNPYQAAMGNIDEEYLTTITTRKGDVVVWEGSTVHGSWPNINSTERLAGITIATPKDAPLLHYYYNQEQQVVEQLAVDDLFFHKVAINERPTGYETVGTVPLSQETFDAPKILGYTHKPVAAKGIMGLIKKIFS